MALHLTPTEDHRIFFTTQISSEVYVAEFDCRVGALEYIDILSKTKDASFKAFRRFKENDGTYIWVWMTIKDTDCDTVLTMMEKGAPLYLLTTIERDYRLPYEFIRDREMQQLMEKAWTAGSK